MRHTLQNYDISRYQQRKGANNAGLNKYERLFCEVRVCKIKYKRKIFHFFVIFLMVYLPAIKNVCKFATSKQNKY